MSEYNTIILNGVNYKIIDSAYNEIHNILKMPGVVVGASNEGSRPVNSKPTATEEGRTEAATFRDPQTGEKFYGDEGLEMAEKYKASLTLEKIDEENANTDPPGTNETPPEVETVPEPDSGGGTVSSASE